jgi:stearoyl-CoA desaturase (delta-9 desaturase)
VFTVNSLCHLFGRRRYATADKSRNNLFVALITLGEGWHNNHHHYQSCANQGFFWWEIDVSYYLIRMLGGCGFVWDIRKPSRKVLDRGRCQPALSGGVTPAPNLVVAPKLAPVGN